jgi:hypothetical protein
LQAFTSYFEEIFINEGYMHDSDIYDSEKNLEDLDLVYLKPISTSQMININNKLNARDFSITIENASMCNRTLKTNMMNFSMILKLRESRKEWISQFC